MEERFYSNVFMWLFVGLMLTFGSAWVSTIYQPLMLFAINNYFIFIIAQLVLCVVISLGIRKMSPSTARALYIGYTLLTGLTFGSIFLAFEIGMLVYVFLATALIFGLFAFIGFKTKKNLNKLGTYLLIGLLALIILELLDVLVFKGSLDITLCLVGIVIFIAYTAYDMQKIKYFAQSGEENLAILGALELYLDFINLFIRILSLLSKRRD